MTAVMDTPVLLIVWRRPSTLSRLIEAIRPVAPSRLFVACDGPRSGRSGELDKVLETRRVIEERVDWTCEIQRLYSDENMGCRLGVSRGISWFFEQVEEGIILEEDCIPHPDFFIYCTSLLERYRNDQRIFSICGSNFQCGQRRGTASYYFSIHGDSWGWATWRRAWSTYNKAEHDWSVFRDSGQLKQVFSIPLERHYWRVTLDQLFKHNLPNTWDYQWFLAGWMNHALHIWPNANLISNAGHDGEGTHTFGANAFSDMPLESLKRIDHPIFVLPDRAADAYSFYRRRSGVRFAFECLLGPLYQFATPVLRGCLRLYRAYGGRY